MLKKINQEEIRSFLLNLNPFILFIWILINTVIPLFYFYLYFWQFEYYHPLQWIFIPDSYTFAILFGIFLFVTLGLKRNIQILNIVTFIGLVKVFFQYLVVFTVMPSFFSIVSLAAHTFEFSEALIILLFMDLDLPNYAIGSSIIITDWFFDYFNPFGLPTLPLFPYHEELNPINSEPHLFIFLIVMTIVIYSLLFLIRATQWNTDGQRIGFLEKI